MLESSLAVALELEVVIRNERLPSAPERLRRDLDILLVNCPFCLACVVCFRSSASFVTLPSAIDRNRKDPSGHISISFFGCTFRINIKQSPSVGLQFD
jgi:hypothetical protein